MDTVRSCPLCGGAAIKKEMMSGTIYYASVNDQYLSRFMDHHNTDGFVRDRLRRAEKIIEELRHELGVKKRTSMEQS